MPEVPNVRDVDGVLVIEWPHPRPHEFTITAEAFEALVELANLGRSLQRDGG